MGGVCLYVPLDCGIGDGAGLIRMLRKMPRRQHLCKQEWKKKNQQESSNIDQRFVTIVVGVGGINSSHIKIFLFLLQTFLNYFSSNLNAKCYESKTFTHNSQERVNAVY